MIAVAAAGLVLLVVVCARWRGRRAAARNARVVLDAHRRTSAAVRRGAADVERVTVLLNEQTERLFVAEQDRDASREIAANHLRRSWRAERALHAVWDRDHAAALVEQAGRATVAAAERMTREAVR